MTAPWAASCDDHRASLAEFIAAVRPLDARAWNAPVREGKWSPAEIAQHLVMTYQVIIKEVGGGGGMRVRVSGMKKLILRALVLPYILRKGRIPRNVRAPREVRPDAAGPIDQASTLARLEAEAATFERELTRHRSTATLTHPFFGTLTAAQALRFCAVHNRHHRGQLPREVS